MAKNHIDIKETVWRKYYFKNEADMNKLVEIMKKPFATSDDIISDDLGFSESETIYDTASEMTVEDNGGNSTIEIYENDKMIWENGK